MKTSKKQSHELAISAYLQYSTKMSDVLRYVYLIFVTLYLFKDITIPTLLILTIVSDVSQYFVSSLIWGINNIKHNNPQIYKNFSNPLWTNIPASVFYALKFLFFVLFLLYLI